MEESPEPYDDMEQENASFRDDDDDQDYDGEEEDDMGESYMEGEQSMGVYRDDEYTPQHQPGEDNQHSMEVTPREE